MKHYIIILMTALAALGAKAQEVDAITGATEININTGAGYAKEVYWGFEEGSHEVLRSSWDIAFTTAKMDVSILANNGNKVQLYTYSKGAINDWETVDTAGMVWKPMYNSIATWQDGAFMQNQVAGNNFDFGWGKYNMSNHHIVGDSLYIIKVGENDYRKLAIIEKDAPANTWYFKYAKLDGSGLKEVTINADDYSSKAFVNYSIVNDEVVNNQAEANKWQLLFTRYYDYTIPYYVSGVLANQGVVVQEVRKSGMNQSTFNTFDLTAFSENISTIGSDWKTFNMAAMAYDIVDTVVYFVRKNPDGAVWKLYFTEFGGMANGKYTFIQEEVSSEGVEETTKAFLSVYPNPATSHISAVYDIDGPTRIAIYNMVGQEVYAETVDNNNQLNKHVIDVQNLPQGVYNMLISNGQKNQTTKFVKQ